MMLGFLHLEGSTYRLTRSGNAQLVLRPSAKGWTVEFSARGIDKIDVIYDGSDQNFAMAEFLKAAKDLFSET